MKTVLKCGSKISQLTLGTVQLGLPYGINNKTGMPSYEESAKILNTALSLGVTSFDTARTYGESEAVLGRYFKENQVDKTIITKVSFDGIDKSAVRDTLFSQVRDSISKLGMEKIPFVKLHSEKMISTYGDTLINALQDLKREGLVSGVGISFSDKTHLWDYTDGAGFDCVQIPANMFDCREILDGGIKTLADRGIAVFIRSLYLQGLFFKNTDELPEKIRSAKGPIESLRTLSRDTGISVAELAITFIRDTDGITSLILGCDTAEQLEESVKLIDAPKMEEAVRARILEISQSVEPTVIRPWEWFS